MDHCNNVSAPSVCPQANIIFGREQNQKKVVTLLLVVSLLALTRFDLTDYNMC
jgi:hypothetical protein